MKINRIHVASLLAAGLVAVSGGVLAAQQEGAMSHSKMSADQHFVMEAASGGMAEVKLGQLAATNASSDKVKDFGKMMVDDHTKANDELKQVAAKQNIRIPSDVLPKDKATYDRLSKLNGAAFDRAYIRDMVKDHQKDIAEFQKEASSGRDKEVKDFAARTLPTLQEHLRMVLDVQKNMGGASASK